MHGIQHEIEISTSCFIDICAKSTNFTRKRIKKIWNILTFPVNFAHCWVLLAWKSIAVRHNVHLKLKFPKKGHFYQLFIFHLEMCRFEKKNATKLHFVILFTSTFKYIHFNLHKNWMTMQVFKFLRMWSRHCVSLDWNGLFQ